MWSNIFMASAEKIQDFHLAINPGSTIQIFKSLLNEVKKFRSIAI